MEAERLRRCQVEGGGNGMELGTVIDTEMSGGPSNPGDRDEPESNIDLLPGASQQVGNLDYEDSNQFAVVEEGNDVEHLSPTSTGHGNYRQSPDIVIEEYPGNAGSSLGIGTPTHSFLAFNPSDVSSNILGNPEVWELARWLMSSGLTARAREDFFKLTWTAGKLPWKSEYEFAKAIDSLPHGPDWKCVQHSIEGEEFDIWMRDPIDCIAELIGNPQFAPHLRYKPQRLYQVSPTGRQRVYSEMWTCDRWWELQESLSTIDPSATILPLIISSDKTQLCTFSDKSAWPVYLSLGNLPKWIRRQLGLQSTILVGYLPISKFEKIEDDTKSRIARHRLFHDSMSILLHALADAGKEGINLVCADTHIRRCYPIITSYIADYPEQCLVAGTLESRCPICEVPSQGRGDLHDACDIRTPRSALPSHAFWRRNDLITADFEDLGLRPLWPFWAKLPAMTSIYESLAPDVLHQLHKGLFKDHLFKWCAEILGATEMNTRYSLMPESSGLRKFSRGVTHLKQTTGTEHREMEKVFIGAIAGAPRPVIQAARSVPDFIYISHFSNITEDDLADLQTALTVFHDNKDFFQAHVGARGFDAIPKIHMLEHYCFLIRKLGPPDGSSTETYERCHIDFAKEGYRASNKVNPFKQMTIYLQRKDAVRLWTSYISWTTGFVFRNAKSVDFTAEDAETSKDTEGHDLLAGPLYLFRNSCLFASIPDPSPTHILAKNPPHRKKLLSWVQEKHASPSLLQDINKFLCGNSPGYAYSLINESDTIDVWTRMRLHHTSHQLPTVDGPITEVVLAKPSASSSRAETSSPGFFSTVLVSHNPSLHGLQGFRAARVKVIFTLPSRLRCFIAEPLALIEYFTAFPSTPPKNHLQFYTLSHEKKTNGQRVTAVVPVRSIKLNCHLIPQFNKLKGTLPRNFDPLNDASPFFLNDFSSHLFYSYMRKWKKETPVD